MPYGSQKSGTFRKVFVKTPGSRIVTHYVERRPKKATCGKCGVILPGTPNERPSKMQNMAKTMKRPSRPYGGVLCSRCMRLHMKAKVR